MALRAVQAGHGLARTSAMTPESVRPLLLAAGLGIRLRPLTARLPKPLVPVCGRPIIEPLLLWLARLGCHEAAINTHWLADRMHERLGTGEQLGVRLHWQHEPELLGGAGTLASFGDFLGDRTALVLNADSLLTADLPSVMATHARLGAVLTLLCASRLGPLLRPVAWDEDGRLRGIRRYGLDDPRGRRRGEFTGLHVVEPIVWQRFVEPGRAVDLVGEVIPSLLKAGLSVAVCEHEGLFVDMGDLAGLVRAQTVVLEHRLADFLQPANEHEPGIWLEPGAQLLGTADQPVYLAAGSSAEPGSHLGPYAVLNARARLCAGQRLTCGTLWSDEYE